MIKIFRKSSKLIIIFILTVIVSGGILAYLSITHISNYRELLEKKISEEERDVSNRFSSDFKNKIDSIASNFSSYLEQSNAPDIQKLKVSDGIKGVNSYIAMDRNGSFLAPNFVDNRRLLTSAKPSKMYLEKLHEAEKNEFDVSDFKSAKNYYLSALRVATSKQDSARVYNSLARLYVKMNLPDEAFEAYQTILTNFQNTSNSSGFPYAYFSILKLLKISDRPSIEPLRALILSFLIGLADGTIPLNDSSAELLDAIEVWQQQNLNKLDNEVFKKWIDLNKNSLLLIDNYKIPIENIRSEKKDERNKDQPIEFLSIMPASGSTDELMLFFENDPISAGVVIGLEPLWIDVLQNLQRKDLTFEYELNLIKKTNSNYPINTNIITTTEFSSYFENSLLQVSLKNENIIDKSVLRRQVTYGIGLVIFLGIMTLGLYLLIQDVNREERMNKLRADFVSNVTHELKTPLTSINMFAEAMNMNKDNLDEKQKKYTTIIVKESEKLKRMINNILEFSKKENNKLTYKLKRSNVTDIVNATLHEMNYFLEINKIDVHVAISKNIFANVHAEGIKQALSNLISNGIKYSSDAKKMNVRLFKKEDKIYIEVEDFGIGIPKEELEFIFEKFYRVHLDDNETASGTGLGLTVSKDIIEEQHGELLVESVLGKGSKFTIVLNSA